MKTLIASATIKSAAKLFTAFALASGAAALLPNCTSETPAEIMGREQSGFACNCPSDSGTCGTWTCEPLRNECTFKPADGVMEGDRCTSAGSEDGTCMGVDVGERNQYFMCCTGCVSGKEGERKCQPGTEVGYCGTRGFACDGCTECQSCSGGACRETTGNSCGTCKVCEAGNCVDEDPGAACAGGRCALAATCCSSCIDTGGACLSSTSEHCGSNGAACTACGQCRTCNNGNCQSTSGSGCDDGNPCTEGDSCNNGTCEGRAIPVDDGNDCTTDSCDPMAGITHANVMPGTTCNDGASCTMDERCNDHDNDPGTPFTCLDLTSIDCVDGNPCTSDTPPCMGTTCPHTPEMNGTPCSNDLRCVFNKACEDGECTGEARNCNDDNPCTTDSCEEMNGANVDPTTGCKHEPRSTSTTCDDANPCTESDHCMSDGSCAGTPKTCTALDECHTAGSCDPGAGECTDPRLQDGTACENTGLCVDGACEGGTPVGSGGSGGAGSGQGGEGGDDTGDAGESSDAGGAGETGGGNGGRGGSGGSGGVGGSTASGGSSGADTTLYVRDPGGCSCRVAGNTSGSAGYLGALVASVLALFVRRRRA